VIRDLDATLVAWLDALLPGVPVSFDGAQLLPPREPERDGTTGLVLHLYDVEEEPDAGSHAWTDLRDAEGRVVGRTPPQRHYRFRYLVSARAKETLDEHELLGRVLAGAATGEVLAPEHLVGSLALGDARVVVRCAPSRGGTRSDSDEGWRATRRTSLELSVLAPLIVGTVAEVGPAPGTVQLGAGRMGADWAAEPEPERPAPVRPAHRITEGWSPAGQTGQG
jgi:hypothetical protein